jgi:predicted enzyme related to lactoylglutathione lyase
MESRARRDQASGPQPRRPRPDLFREIRRAALRRESGWIRAILINGQQFLMRTAVCIWTATCGYLYVRRIMIKQIKFVSIPVADQNRALDFYTDKLGFTIITDQPFDGKQRWIELRIPKADTRVVLFTPEGDEKRIGSFINMSYACDDIEKTYAELKKRGVEFEGPPQKQPWGTYAMFKDSEGNRFVVSSD